MDLTYFLNQLNENTNNISFNDTMSVIEQYYVFTETAFSNGDTYNAAGQNNGSCKIFAFALLNQLSEQQCLACFGAYYRNDVLANPQGNDHQNIRNFIKYGWAGIRFEGEALRIK